MALPTLRREFLVPALVILALTVLLLAGPEGHGNKPTATNPTTSLFDRPAPPPQPGLPDANIPRTVEDLRTLDRRGSRCAEGERRTLVIFHGDQLARAVPVDEALTGPGSVELPLVLDTLTRALPLAALAAERPQATTIEVWPCQGEAVRVPVTDLTSNPNRWILIRTPRVFLKLLDGEAHDKRPVLRNVAAVRLVP